MLFVLLNNCLIAFSLSIRGAMQPYDFENVFPFVSIHLKKCLLKNEVLQSGYATFVTFMSFPESFTLIKHAPILLDFENSATNPTYRFNR